MINRWEHRREIRPCHPQNNGQHVQVTFSPCEGNALVTRLAFRSLQTSYSNSSHVNLIFSPFYTEPLKKACEKFGFIYREAIETFTQFDTPANESNDNNFHFLQASWCSLEKYLDARGHTQFINFMNYCNQYIKPDAFSAELIADLENCYQAGLNGDFNSQTFLTDPAYYHKQLISSSRRPAYQSLADRLAYENSEVYKKYLIEGDNPNEPQGNGGDYTPLTYAILRQKKFKPLELLLWYGANPFARPSSEFIQPLHSYNALELAIAFGQIEKANIINHEFSRLKKTSFLPANNKNNLLISNITAEIAGQSVISKFLLNDGRTISTVLKRAKDMSKQEFNSAFNLFSQNFELTSDMDEQLINVFMQDFSGNKWIDFIKDGDEIIGFNLYEFVDLPDKCNEKYVYCAYAAIIPAYRNLGLMLILSLRMGYIQKCMSPEKEIGFFFCAAHYNSYRLVNFKHFPKYQTDESQHTMLALTKEIFGQSASQNYHHHLLKSYYVDKVRVRSPANDKHIKYLDERMFLSEIMDINDVELMTNHTRNGTILFYVNEENYRCLENAALERGIDFNTHIQQFSNCLKKINLSPTSDTYSSSNKLTLFYHDSKVGEVSSAMNKHIIKAKL